MSATIVENTLEAKAHELVSQLGPTKLAAVVQLMEVMVEDEEPVTAEDQRRFREGQAWFADRGGQGIPMEEVLAEFGLSAADFPVSK